MKSTEQQSANLKDMSQPIKQKQEHNMLFARLVEKQLIRASELILSSVC